MLDLDHKRLSIRVITIKNIAVQYKSGTSPSTNRVHLSAKIFDIYFN